jgi:acetoin utilization deacetylase AcuC-like enzyme
VTTLSLHGRNNFPLRKERSSIDIELDDGAGDVEYLERLDPALERVFAGRPALVFYQAGVDALETDRLGRLGLTPEGLSRRDRLVFHRCRTAGVPLVLTLGGGYSDPIEATVEAHASTFLVAAEMLG